VIKGLVLEEVEGEGEDDLPSGLLEKRLGNGKSEPVGRIGLVEMKLVGV